MSWFEVSREQDLALSCNSIDLRGPGGFDELRDLYRRICRTTAERYRGQIPYIEVMNEAHDKANLWRMTHEQVLEMARTVFSAVREGDPLLVIESMKLQSTLFAAIDGSVAELSFAVGQSFQRGAVLARVHPAEAAT